MNVGDVVVPSDITPAQRANGEHKFTLACGSGWYTHAIVVDTDPFVLVSEHGDMRWSTTIDPSRFTALCQAHPDIVNKAMTRYIRDKESGQL